MIKPSRRSFLQSALVSTSSALFLAGAPTIRADETERIKTQTLTQRFGQTGKPVVAGRLFSLIKVCVLSLSFKQNLLEWIGNACCVWRP